MNDRQQLKPWEQGSNRVGFFAGVRAHTEACYPMNHKDRMKQLEDREFEKEYKYHWQ